MQRTPQFITGDFEPHHCFLPDDEYGRALDAMVKAVSDILVTSKSGTKVFLGRRKVEPQPDWWYIGGRSKPGETAEKAAARNVRRELKLDIPVERFEVIANYSFVWQFRQQAPQGNGTADISTVHCLELSDEEVSKAEFDNKEYSECKWFDVEEVLAGEFHPALKQAIWDSRCKASYKELENIVAKGGDDAAVAAAARNLVVQGAPPARGFEPVKVRFSGGKYEYVGTPSAESKPLVKRRKAY
uniref:Nudix hydrolase domain-containing protein n=1 Tax=Helicotheca tamesis TaxID=374047 RepID=A0A7S2N1I2_9STRA|mmetsp:Transcript_7569/g.10288  ORF Transcript_7569/g.10288 Transcript_7569/m.10288 type:complete len:243 (+) Transcript_7569:61-789(+)